MLNPKKIILRADGNSSTGLGHMYRMFAVAEFYANDYEIIFVTNINSTQNIIPSEYLIITIPENISLSEEPNWLSNKFPPNKNQLILDGYQFDSKYQKKIKDLGFTFIYIDDLEKGIQHANIVINHSPNTNKKRYKSNSQTNYALGTNFAILRPSFLKVAKENREFKSIKEVFICFGGADPFDLSFKAVLACLELNCFEKIHVVLGGAYKHKDIYIEEKKNLKIILYKNLNEFELVKLMKSCQFSIAPSSTILYELCSVKMPILSGYFVNNQEKIYKELVSKELVFGGGNFENYTIKDFKHQVSNVLKNKNFTKYIQNQKKMFDGKSKNRFLGLLNSLNLNFEKANLDHLELVYKWSNDTLVRKNSYHSKEIDFDAHVKWFKSKIINNNVLFLIVLVNNNPAGVVRYEVEKDKTVVGILVSKKYRGQGLSYSILVQSSKIYFNTYKNPIFAHIKKENIASIKSFQNAGYLLFKEEKINNIESYIYKLEKNSVE